MGFLVIHNPVEQQDNAPPEGHSSLNQGETTSILSLIAYAAYAHQIGEDRILSATLHRFKADMVSNIKSHHYDKAVRYLVDLQPNELINLKKLGQPCKR